MIEIYYLHYGENQTPFYVGATSQGLKKRLWQHRGEGMVERCMAAFKMGKNDFTYHPDKRIKKKLKLGITLIELVPFEDARRKEKEWYELMKSRGCTLVNCTRNFTFGTGYSINKKYRQLDENRQAQK